VTSTFSENILSVFKKRYSHARRDPEWIQARRAKSMQWFTDNDLPDRKSEDWRYTDLNYLNKLDLSWDHCSHSDIDLAGIDGVEVLKGAEALETWKRQFADRDLKGDPLVLSLNEAFFVDTTAIIVKKNQVVDRPLRFDFGIAQMKNDTLIAPRLLVIIEENAQATLIENYDLTSGASLKSSLSTIMLKENSSLCHVRCQKQNDQSVAMGNTDFHLQKDARLQTLTVNIAGRIARHFQSVHLNQEGAEAEILGISLVDNNNVVDNQTDVFHHAPNCKSLQHTKGVLNGQSRNVYTGKVIIDQGAQQTDSDQLTQNLVLSEKAEADARPQLEVWADDVKATHGATVGQLDPEQIFYLMTRCIDPDQARVMLMSGFVDEIAGKIKDEKIKKEMRSLVAEKMK
jgi:Fe-S cluster assembly protein SufD